MHEQSMFHLMESDESASIHQVGSMSSTNAHNIYSNRIASYLGENENFSINQKAMHHPLLHTGLTLCPSAEDESRTIGKQTQQWPGKEKRRQILLSINFQFSFVHFAKDSCWINKIEFCYFHWLTTLLRSLLFIAWTWTILFHPIVSCSCV